MSDKEKLSEFLTAMFKKQSEDLQNQINKAMENLKSTSPSSEPQKPRHVHSANVEFECPECQKIYDSQVAAEAVSAFKKKVKGMKQPKLCEGPDCEEIYDGENKEDCPTCHRHGN